VLAWGLGWTRTFVIAWVSERVSAGLRNTIYTHFQRLSLDYFSDKRTGDLIARVSTDTDRICFFLSVYMLDFASDILMVTMTAGILLSINPGLALVTLCPFPVIAWITFRVRQVLRRGFAKSTRAWGDMTSVLADAIPGVRVVKAFAQEQREIERFGDANKQVVRANDRVNRVWSFFGPMVTLLTDLGVLIIWASAVWMIFKGQVTVGVLTAFVAYISRFYARMESMIRMVSAFERTAASAKRIFDVLDVEPSVVSSPTAVEPGKLRGKIEFREVSFSYGKRDILRSINLTVQPGEMVGFVGPSGSGKSTLLNLVCRFYDVCQGAVLADDTDVRELTLEGYRANIGIVLQEPFLFYGTIAENIAYGKPDASREEIIEAARTACAHDFIICLPDGYDTLVGERGQLLSGGERQRISIARAILINPSILILDEATSAVDVETEKAIQQAVENLVKGRTTLAVAHRLSTLKRADRIVVLEDGAITAVGKHAELLATSPTYARFHHTNAEMYLSTVQGMRDSEPETAPAGSAERYADF
jgi:ATP-binding cassette subfamily B protein